ncbi:MAG: D-glycero-alpha-D-manno-heptose-1,7-bisphosphate 7-phosphatase [Verrucomicrobiae bacterium]|nr:D-glycero-alpha-D-manno-heptose-1,7-bisphosphate 7-phosphatase [Verrucomicrobiae bacterium]
MSNRAVFLDRDGVLMQDSNYVGHVERVVILDSAPHAVRRLQEAGFRVFVVTNQSGVGRGYFTRQAVDEIHALLDREFAKVGARIERYYVCPHHPEDKCACRKPSPKLLQQAAAEFALDLKQCYMIGDRRSDVECGQNAGARAVLVLTGAGAETLAKGEARPDHVAATVGAAVDWILGQK